PCFASLAESHVEIVELPGRLIEVEHHCIGSETQNQGSILDLVPQSSELEHLLLQKRQLLPGLHDGTEPDRAPGIPRFLEQPARFFVFQNPVAPGQSTLLMTLQFPPDEAVREAAE